MDTATHLHPRTLDEREPHPGAEDSLLQGWLQHEPADLVAGDAGLGGARPQRLEEVVEALRALEEEPCERGGTR
jgi:hypothetical protein